MNAPTAAAAKSISQFDFKGPRNGGTVSIFDWGTKIYTTHGAAKKRNTKFGNDLLFVKYKSKEIQS